MIKYKAFILVLCLVCAHEAKSQFLVLKASWGSCAKCTLPLNYFKEVAKNRPVFISFPKSYASDSDLVERSFGFKRNGFALIFSDDLEKGLQNYEEGAFILDDNFKLVAATSFLTINNQIVDSLIGILDKMTIGIVKPSEDAYMSNDTLYEYSVMLRQLNVWVKGKKVSYLLNQTLAEKWRTVLKEKGMLPKSDSLFTILQNENPQLFPGFEAFAYRAPYIYLTAVMFVPHPTDTNSIIGLNAIFKFKDQQLIAIQPIEINGLESTFALINTQSPIITPSGDLIMPAKQIKDSSLRFMSVFKLKDGKYTYDHMLDVKLTQAYYESFKYNLINAMVCDYPYYSPPVENSIYNLETGVRFWTLIKRLVIGK